MRRAIVVCLAALSALAPIVPASAQPGVAVGFENPESVYWHADTGTWYASNFGGYTLGTSTRDGNGFISRVAPGEVVPTPWVGGLDAPKGMRAHDGLLYVADVAHVVVIDIEAGEIVRRIDLEGQFLNDVATDPATGHVFVSDMNANTIYRITDGSDPVVEVFVEGAALNSPNGLLVVDGALIVAQFGAIDRGLLGGAAGGILSIDLDTREATTLATGIGTLDGIEQDADAWLVTDWAAGQLVRVSPDGSALPIAQLAPGSADLAWEPDSRTAAVPSTPGNFVAFVPVV